MANVILNPSFEDGLAGNPPEDWVVSGTGNGNAITQTDARAFDGSNSARLNAQGTSSSVTISQTFDMVAGQMMEVSYALRPYVVGKNGLHRCSVVYPITDGDGPTISINGGTVVLQEVQGCALTGPEWRTQVAVWTAPENTTVRFELSLQGVASCLSGIVIDNVVVDLLAMGYG